MKDDEAWDVELQLWTGGATHYRKYVDPRCVMAFPVPAGIMPFDAIMKSLDKMPRWSSVKMVDKLLTHPADDVMVLAYKAEGTRAAEAAYNAFCTSTYRHAEDGWRLVQHQQTPA